MEIRLLFESDIPAAMRLKEAAGWNQTEDDWRRLLLLEPNGCFCAIKDGCVVGTTTTTTYGDELAWIGMVLVDSQHRRQGIAAKLMSVALDYLNGKVATVKLDATALGQPVYEKFGFQFESLIERWSGTERLQSEEQGDIGRYALSELLALDRIAFNADRSKLIEALIDTASVPPVLVRGANGALSGYAMVRSGTRADYVGPIVTKDAQQVEPLITQMLNRLSDRRVYIDFNTECGGGSGFLYDRGFVKERDLIRMRAGRPSPKTSSLIVGIAGPEIG